MDNVVARPLIKTSPYRIIKKVVLLPMMFSLNCTYTHDNWNNSFVFEPASLECVELLIFVSSFSPSIQVAFWQFNSFFDPFRFVFILFSQTFFSRKGENEDSFEMLAVFVCFTISTCTYCNCCIVFWFFVCFYTYMLKWYSSRWMFINTLHFNRSFSFLSLNSPVDIDRL